MWFAASFSNTEKLLRPGIGALNPFQCQGAAFFRHSNILRAELWSPLAIFESDHGECGAPTVPMPGRSILSNSNILRAELRPHFIEFSNPIAGNAMSYRQERMAVAARSRAPGGPREFTILRSWSRIFVRKAASFRYCNAASARVAGFISS